MTRRFCDLCDRQLEPTDDQPFIRQIEHLHGTVVVSLAVTNERLHAITDICNDCKLKVVNEGKPFNSKQIIATLQSDRIPSPDTPSIFKTVSFEPSAQPATNPQQKQNG
jgi:hypothetical protein